MPHRGVLRAAAIFGALWLVALSAPPTEARTLTGTGGADRLTGTTRADVISGKGGADRLFGRKGADRLLGGEGLDRLSGGAGVDILNGGPGRDILDCGPGRDRAAADRRDTVRRNCESVSGRGGGGSQPPQQQPPQQQPPPPPTVQGDFTGTLTTTVRYVHVCTGQVIAEQTTQIPSRVTIRPPLQPIPTDLPATLPEANPINLILGQTDVAGTTAPGSVNIASGARFRFSAIRSLILRYWNLTLNGTTLTGTLTEDNREQGAAFNLLAAWQELAPCFPQHGSFVNQLAIAEGATLTGTITPQSVQLRIAGNTIDTFHPFVAEITAARSG